MRINAKVGELKNRSIKTVGWHLTDNLAILISIVGGEDL